MPKVYKKQLKDIAPRRFKDAGDASKELYDDFGAWTASLGKYALQLAFALMAANWALHGSSKNILDNPWATASMFCAVLYLTAFVVLMRLRTEEVRRQYEYAEGNKDLWHQEYLDNLQIDSRWPYTKRCEDLAGLLQWLHFLGPLLCGLLLLISVYVGDGTRSPPPMQPCSGRSCIPVLPCCDSKVVQSQSGFSVGQGGASAGSIDVQATQTLHVPLLALIVSALATVLGIGVAVNAKRVSVKAAASAVATIGVVTLSAGGLTLVKDVKLESLFTLKTNSLIDLVHYEVSQAGARLERIAALEGFKVGESTVLDRLPPEELSPGKSPEAVLAARRWIEQRRRGFDGVLLIVGSADRLRLTGAKDRQFDANVGLARARAEEVRAGIIAAARDMAPGLEPKPEQVLVLISGPRQTPSLEDSTPRGSRLGYPDDRRVDVWAFWTPPSVTGALNLQR